jgi:alpha-beta hydrolase superfamily lysophospholipase
MRLLRISFAPVLASAAIAACSTSSAAVILLPGGAGLLDLSETGIGQGANNFCVRTRQAFAEAGFVVAVPDAPSNDHTSAGLNGVRASLEHAEDLSALVQWLRTSYEGLSVWVVGTSRGTISTADVAVRFPAPKGPDHIVLTSSVTVVPKFAADKEDIQSVPGFEAGLSARVPILMIDNALDQCGASPPLPDPSKGILGAQGLAELIGDAKHFVLVEGGTTPPADASVCGGLSYHGFYGLESEVVPKIVNFIQAH